MGHSFRHWGYNDKQDSDGGAVIYVLIYLSSEGNSHCGVDKWRSEGWERASNVMISASHEKTLCAEILSQGERWPFEESEKSLMSEGGCNKDERQFGSCGSQ